MPAVVLAGIMLGATVAGLLVGRLYGLRNRVPHRRPGLEVMCAAVGIAALALHLAPFGRGGPRC